MGEFTFRIGEKPIKNVKKVFLLHQISFMKNICDLKYVIILILFFFCNISLSQVDLEKEKRSSKSRQSAIKKVVRSLENNEAEDSLAYNYEKLAREFFINGDYFKAEDYFKRALSIYEKIDNRDKIASTYREIAKIYETKNNLDDAVLNYNMAGDISNDIHIKEVNYNDANRLLNYSNPKVQQSYINENIQLLSGISGNPEERANAWQQMAQTKVELEDRSGAIADLEMALDEVKDIPEEAIKINSEIAKLYLVDNQTDKAIEISKKNVEDAQKVNNSQIEIVQLQNLSDNYFEANKSEEGMSALKQAYDLALKEGRTMDAKNTLQIIINRYGKENDQQKVIELYSGFIDELDNLVKNDSTLLDDRFFIVLEDRILQLEKERILKDELINKTNTFNIALVCLILLILAALILIIRSLYSIKKKNKKIALQSLRREMNPHFIFNSLNSVNQFISENDEFKANKYLSSYSSLMRNVMENSNKDFIPLSVEIEHMNKYLELERMRFDDKFIYKINVDEYLDVEAVFVPNMLIQPHLENAIWHGLRYRSSIGVLNLEIKKDEDYLVVKIEDNGVGLTKSKELKTKHQKEHKSRGLNNTHERIKLLNNLYNTDISISISEKTEDGTGVIVILKFPVKYQNNK